MLDSVILRQMSCPQGTVWNLFFTPETPDPRDLFGNGLVISLEPQPSISLKFHAWALCLIYNCHG